MKRIIFRKGAENDLNGIIDYYTEITPRSVPNILADIYSSIDQLATFPHSAMEVGGSTYGLRRIVTRKYHFNIVHEVTDDTVNIIGIFRYQDRES